MERHISESVPLLTSDVSRSVAISRQANLKGLQGKRLGVCWMVIRSRAFVREPPCVVCSVIPICGSCASNGAQKTVWGCSGLVRSGWHDRRLRRVRDLSSVEFRIVPELEVRRVACRSCGTVKRERLDFLADNAHFTKRFAFYVGRRRRQASIRDVAKELKLDWETIKTLEKQYKRAQLERAGRPGPRSRRHRRDLRPQGPQLSHRGQRLGPQAADCKRSEKIPTAQKMRATEPKLSFFCVALADRVQAYLQELPIRRHFRSQSCAGNPYSMRVTELHVSSKIPTTPEAPTPTHRGNGWASCPATAIVLEINSGLAGHQAPLNSGLAATADLPCRALSVRSGQRSGARISLVSSLQPTPPRCDSHSSQC
jgi:Helix-turn-helix domain of transposase family ISL3